MPPTDMSILVCGRLPPLPDSRIVFSPGSGASFDGDRWYLSLAVTVMGDDSTYRRLFDRRELSEALDTVRDEAQQREPSAVVLDGRDWLRGPFPARAVDRIEARLERVAREVGAILVVRTWDAVSADDRGRYGAVIDLADGRTWRGEPMDPPQRPGSHSPDTERRPPSSGA